MIVDSSAVLAIMRQEPEALAFSETLEKTEGLKMSVLSYVETAVMVDSARDPIVSRKLDDLLRAAAIEIVPVTVEQGRIAREAYRDFGRGSGHAAKLNFGDCFSYALARDSDEPLLFKGNDFGATDVRLV